MKGVDARHDPSLATRISWSSILLLCLVAAQNWVPSHACFDFATDPVMCWPLTLCSPLPLFVDMNASLHRSAFLLIVHLHHGQRRLARDFIRVDLQEDVLPRIALMIRIISDVLDHEHLLHRFQEVHISPSSSLEAEVTDGVGANEVTQRLL